MKRNLLIGHKNQKAQQLQNLNKEEEIFEKDDHENSLLAEAEFSDNDEEFLNNESLEQQQLERDLEIFQKKRQQEVDEKLAKQLQEAENEKVTDKNPSQFFTALPVTQNKSTISTFKKNGVDVQGFVKTSDQELTKVNSTQILIPADGDCLYTTVFVGYLLPVINDEGKFSERLIKLTGNNSENDNLRKTLIDGCHNVEIFKEENFKKYILKFKIHMRLNDGKWAGKDEIKILADELNIIIHEETDNINIPPITTEPTQSANVSEIIYILQTNADIKEAVQESDDIGEIIARIGSLNTAQHAQHYRLILKGFIPAFREDIVDQLNESCSTDPLNITKSKDALSSYKDTLTSKLPIPRPKGLSNEDEKFIREEINKAFKKGIGTEKVNDISIVERPPFQFPIKKIELLSPVPVISKLYANASTSEQKQACLRYLLHYQHYNAEFINSENDRLGYPKPLCAQQELPGYFRTEYHRLLQLLQPWVEKYLQPFYTASSQQGNKKITEFIKFGSVSSIHVMKTFFPEQLVELSEFCNRHEKNNAEPPGKIAIVRLKLDEIKNLLSNLEEEIKKVNKKLNPGALRVKNPNLQFLFVLEVSFIDFVVTWGAKWAKPKKDNTLEFLTLDKLFNENVFSLINKLGAVPDRLSVNQLLTYQAGDKNSSFESDYRDIHLFPKLDLEIDNKTIEPIKAWNDFIEIIEGYRFKNDNGIEIYRNAILRWNNEFFKKHSEILDFAIPLLCTQVKPWLLHDSSLVQWAKAYQNLCEIILLCLDFFPDLHVIDLTSIALQNLDPNQHFQVHHKSAGSHAYGMNTFFDIFYQIMQRDEFKDKKISVACISQNYFETLSLMESMEAKNRISLQTKDSLKAIHETPDILIADVHPNNASKDQLHQNNIAQWIRTRLESNPDKKIILILDITLNYLQDTTIQEMLTVLRPYIENGKLDFFGMQSLAKLIQFGADSFSGGLGFYLGVHRQLHTFANTQSPKAKFFALIFQHFQDITGRYFEQVRHNTDWIYKKLVKCFEDVAKEVTYKEDEVKDGEKNTLIRNLSAAQVTLNVDEGTVYVAIGFKPFFEIIKLQDAKQQEEMVGNFIKLLLDMASFRGLPITGRQSFGFSFSNMSHTVQAIRFSIGVENEILLSNYVELLKDFNYALSRYAVIKRDAFNVAEFKEVIEGIYKLLQEGGVSKPLAVVDLLVDSLDEYGRDFRKKVGNATVSFVENQLRLGIQKDSSTVMKRKPRMQVEPHIGIEERYYSGCYWSYTDLFQLFLQLKYINHKTVYVLNNCIGGFIEIDFAFLDESHHEDKESGVVIRFEPDFTLTTNGNVYTADSVFVVLPELVSTPIRVAKLIAERRYLNHIYTQCVQFNLKVTTHNNSDVLLEFAHPKPVVNFLQLIKDNYKQRKLLGVVSYLNDKLDFTNLPLVKKQFWYSWGMSSLDSLHRVLKSLGSFIAKRLSKSDIERLQEIKDDGCKKAIIEGIYQSLFEDSYNKDRNLTSQTAENLAAMFLLPEFQKFVDSYIFDDWLIKLEDYLVKSSDNVDRVIPYLMAFFPIVQYFYVWPGNLCDTDHSTSLCSIAHKVNGYPALKKYIDELEQAIPSCVLEVVKNASSVTKFLELYIRYPLSNNIKAELLSALSKISSDLLSDWINSPGFYYSPTDQFDISMTADQRDLILDETDQSAMNTFFAGSGCRNILLKQIDIQDPEILVTAVRWAIMTQDEILFSQILKICCQQQEEINLEGIQHYLTYLKMDVDIQNQLYDFLNDLLKQAKESISDHNNALSASLELERDSYNQVATDILQQLVDRSTQKLDEEAVKQYILSLIEEAMVLTLSINETPSVSIMPSFDYAGREIERNLFRFFNSELRAIAPKVCKRWQNLASASTAPIVPTDASPTYQK